LPLSDVKSKRLPSDEFETWKNVEATLSANVEKFVTPLRAVPTIRAI